MGQSLPKPTGAGPQLKGGDGTVLTCANTSWAYANGFLMGLSLPIPTGDGPLSMGRRRDSPILCHHELGVI